METAKIVLVLGLGASVVATGLAYGVAALTGGTVTGDEIARHVLISFVIAASAVLVLRRRAPR